MGGDFIDFEILDGGSGGSSGSSKKIKTFLKKNWIWVLGAIILILFFLLRPRKTTGSYGSVPTGYDGYPQGGGSGDNTDAIMNNVNQIAAGLDEKINKNKNETDETIGELGNTIVENNKNMLDYLNESLTSVRTDMVENDKKIMDSMNNYFDSTNDRFNRMDNVIKNNYDELLNLNKNSIAGVYNDMNAMGDQFNSKLSNMQSDFNSSLSYVNSNIDSLHNKFDNMSYSSNYSSGFNYSSGSSNNNYIPSKNESNSSGVNWDTAAKTALGGLGMVGNIMNAASSSAANKNNTNKNNKNNKNKNNKNNSSKKSDSSVDNYVKNPPKTPNSSNKNWKTSHPAYKDGKRKD